MQKLSTERSRTIYVALCVRHGLNKILKSLQNQKDDISQWGLIKVKEWNQPNSKHVIKYIFIYIL